MSVASSGSAPYYFVPAPSKWPLVGSISMLFFMFGMSGLVNGAAYGPYAMAVGFAILVYMFFGWFGVVIHESEAGRYNHRVDASFRWSMGWFIFSEVMFFAGFFGALFYARTISMPWLGDLDHKAILWPDFSAHWPNNGPVAPAPKPFQGPDPAPRCTGRGPPRTFLPSPAPTPPKPVRICSAAGKFPPPPSTAPFPPPVPPPATGPPGAPAPAYTGPTPPSRPPRAEYCRWFAPNPPAAPPGRWPPWDPETPPAVPPSIAG
ncbi:MAG: hypothetical protein EBT03_07565 [Betaproteobacteria bacterium]|nr:hypothetical protein [Betaproteobacteria bacterium]